MGELTREQAETLTRKVMRYATQRGRVMRKQYLKEQGLPENTPHPMPLAQRRKVSKLMQQRLVEEFLKAKKNQ